MLTEMVCGYKGLKKNACILFLNSFGIKTNSYFAFPYCELTDSLGIMHTAFHFVYNSSEGQRDNITWKSL